MKAERSLSEEISSRGERTTQPLRSATPALPAMPE
jgi:hypothetical protein